jgi:sporulation protein YlmC with PRC-barrel domain
MAATRWTEIRLSSDGEHVGKVSEIMLDVRSRRIAYAVLAEGGFLGMGTTLHARPWNALTLDTDEKCFRVDITAQKINEPGFATHRYYNRTPTGLRLRFRGNTND